MGAILQSIISALSSIFGTLWSDLFQKKRVNKNVFLYLQLHECYEPLLEEVSKTLTLGVLEPTEFYFQNSFKQHIPKLIYLMPETAQLYFSSVEEERDLSWRYNFYPDESNRLDYREEYRELIKAFHKNVKEAFFLLMNNFHSNPQMDK